MNVQVERSIIDSVRSNMHAWESNMDPIIIASPYHHGGYYGGYWWKGVFGDPKYNGVAMVRSGKLVLNLTGLR